MLCVYIYVASLFGRSLHRMVSCSSLNWSKMFASKDFKSSRVPLQMPAEATDSVTECHRGFFCGSDWVWAWLDLGIVLISLAEIAGDIVTKASKSWLDDSWWANDFASFSGYMMVYGSLVDVR